MAIVKSRALRLSAVSIMVGLGLGACASPGQNVPVQNVPSSAGGTAAAPTGVQAVTQYNALLTEIRELRNQLEEQQFELENMRQRQQDLFQGLDQRLRVTEAMQQGGNIINPDGTVTTPSVLPPIATDGVGAPGQVPGQPPVATDPNLPTQVTVGQPTTVVTPPAQPVDEADQQALYDEGFEYLKQSQYNRAIELFAQLVETYPNGGLADDAAYWIGEANYVNRQYEAAIQSFRKVVAQYPQSDRVPEALLKVGYVQYDIGDYQNARTTFEDVLRRYPDHPVSISARSRLQRINQGISG